VFPVRYGLGFYFPKGGFLHSRCRENLRSYINRSVSVTRNTPTSHHVLLRDSFTFSNVDDVRTSQKTHLRATTCCYGDSFTFSYIDDFRTSQGTHLGPWFLTGRALLFHMMTFVRHRRHAYGPPRSVTEIALLFHM
jgi:hypothetical protein